MFISLPHSPSSLSLSCSTYLFFLAPYTSGLGILEANDDERGWLKSKQNCHWKKVISVNYSASYDSLTRTGKLL